MCVDPIHTIHTFKLIEMFRKKDRKRVFIHSFIHSFISFTKFLKKKRKTEEQEKRKKQKRKRKEKKRGEGREKARFVNWT